MFYVKSMVEYNTLIIGFGHSTSKIIVLPPGPDTTVTRMTERSLRARTREELFTLLLERGEVTRSELAALTGMSRSTINQSLGRLVADGRIIEVANETKGPGSGRGRPGVR